MPLRKCTDCRKKVSDQAGRCPNYGAPVVPQPAKPFRSVRRFFSGFFWVIVAFMVIGAMLPDSNSSSNNHSVSGAVVTTPTGYTIDKHGAVASCRMQVEDSLKSPSTAKFVNPWGDESLKPRLKDNTWEQLVAVDAQNSFGAVIRSKWLCVIDGSDGTVFAKELN